jgi:hypothetical protein
MVMMGADWDLVAVTRRRASIAMSSVSAPGCSMGQNIFSSSGGGGLFTSTLGIFGSEIDDGKEGEERKAEVG